MSVMTESYVDSSTMDAISDTADNDEIFPCKGCGVILEEGKAFELAGSRWHLDCFRCNTCNTLLDSDANLLLLGDGSLICNNCTYSCNACGNKIEDLAILTGDQAFCATCFRCRNCKRKIENLRYARTSQGIFCMGCHESLMARRRKKTKAAAATTQAKARDKGLSSPMITEKSLPALPPNASVNDRRPSTTPNDLSPRPRTQNPVNEPYSLPELPANEPSQGPAPTLPYRNNRASTLIMSGDRNAANGNGTATSASNGTGGDADDGFYIPVALDQSTPSSAATRSVPVVPSESKMGTPKDYFNISKPAVDRRTESQGSTPHIAFQEKGRQPSSDYETWQQPKKQLTRQSSKVDTNNLSKVSPRVADNRRPGQSTTAGDDDFRLQDAPKTKRLGASPNINNSQSTMTYASANSSSAQRSEKEMVTILGSALAESPSPQHLPARSGPGTSPVSQSSADDDHPRPSMDSVNNNAMSSDLSSSGLSQRVLPSALVWNGNNVKQGPQLSSKGGGTSEESSPSVFGGRPAPLEHKLTSTYLQPRAALAPPNQGTPKSSSLITATINTSSPCISQQLLRWQGSGDFSMDEDMARILGTDEGTSSIMRRVSNVVRHGRSSTHETVPNTNPVARIAHCRSVSETPRPSVSPTWPQTPVTDALGSRRPLGSPVSLMDDPAVLKRQLRTSEQRLAELQRQVAADRELQSLQDKLVEKRRTVSDLDSQTEVMIRQLEVLAGYVECAKNTKQPIDPKVLEESAIKEFVQKLEEVKQSLASTIEQLHAERDELIAEKNQATAERDRALIEFEQLSSKNAQLADMNNDLTHQIQERFKSQINTAADPKYYGLGIYSQVKGTLSSVNLSQDPTNIQTGNTTLVPADPEEPVVEGPTVVNIRKGQVKKFNWKKGSSKVAHNISKGINKAAIAFSEANRPQTQPQHGNNNTITNTTNSNNNNNSLGLTGDNIGLPYNMTVAPIDTPSSLPPPSTAPNSTTNRGQMSESRQGFGFFSTKKSQNTMTKSSSMSNMVFSQAAVEAPTTLFGSELAARVDHEGRHIPGVVIRCIEEVETRGMDIEGIYRKTGANSQIRMIQEGFDKNYDYNISDPDVDITAVTSVLKQYLRRLPTPLLTYDVYERVLESNSIANEDERAAYLKRIVNSMPPTHRDVLEFLMFHLTRVAMRERENLMTSKNLAVVFAPTIMRDHSLEKEITDMRAKNIAVQFMIDHSEEIFTPAQGRA